jgi:hypothetical protein
VQRLHDLATSSPPVFARCPPRWAPPHVVVRGRSSNLVFGPLDEELTPSQEDRALCMRELIRGGVLGPSFVVSSALTDEDIDKTVHAVGRRAWCTARRWTRRSDPVVRREIDQAGVPSLRVT